MNIRKVTAVVSVCIAAVYLNHRFSEAKLMECRYYAKGLATGLGLKSEHTDNPAALARPDMLFLKSLLNHPVPNRYKLNDSLAATNEIYKAAYHECVSYK